MTGVLCTVYGAQVYLVQLAGKLYMFKQTNFDLTTHQETTKLNVNEFIFELQTTKF